MEGTIRAICVSDVRGIQKTAVESAEIQFGWGIGGDAHGGDWHRQVSLLSGARVDAFNRLGAEVSPGAFGENLVVDGLDPAALPVGTWLTVGKAVLAITQIGKECHTRCAIFDKMGECIMPHAGTFARVLRGGAIRVGDLVTVHPLAGVRAAVLTLSDQCAAGKRADESGPVAAELLTCAGAEVVRAALLPDDCGQIQAALISFADDDGVDLVLTTGGTGFSPRDVTPEATLAVAHRLAPGIAEALRAHSMQLTSRAMFSRAVSVLRGGTLIVNLPGSPNAVRESLEYLLPELPHALAVLRGRVSNCAVGDSPNP